eukprot:m.55113 g.55113  ORF g.55113 m.55113 type:complete len:565 (+) comp12506_c0_seq3:185-1879(+)
MKGWSAMTCLVHAAFVAVVVLPSHVSAFSWQQLNPAGTLPPARANPGLAFDDGGSRLFVFGGQGAAGVLNDTWSYSFQSNSWTELSPTVVPPARQQMVAGPRPDGFAVAAGVGQQSQPFNDVWQFDAGANTWTQLDQASPHHPEPRFGGAGGIFDPTSNLYLSHGKGDDDLFSDTWRFDFDTNEWRKIHGSVRSLSPRSPHARFNCGSAMTGAESFVMYGGCLSGANSGGLCPSNDAWQWNNGDWDQQDTCPSPRLLPGLAFVGAGQVAMYGGQQNVKQVVTIVESSLRNVDLLDVSSGVWRPFTVDNDTQIPAFRFGAGMTTYEPAQQLAVMFGGQSRRDADTGPDSPLLNDLWVLEANAEKGALAAVGCGSFLSLPFLHGIFMFVGWGVCLQTGALIARYFREKDPWWFKMHVRLQVLGLILALVGFGLAIASVEGNHFSFAHGGFGLAIMIAGVVNFLGAWQRPVKEPGSTSWAVFSFAHKLLGRLALFSAMVNIGLGLLLMVAPMAVWVFWFVLFFLWVITHFGLEHRKREREALGLAKKTDSLPTIPEVDGSTLSSSSV